MNSIRSAAMRAVFGALAFASAFAAVAATATFQVLLDLDGNPGTGCPVSTAKGAFAGVEQILATTVITSTTTAMVTGVTRRVCAGGVFGATIVVDGGTWLVGLGNGVGGMAVIETLIPRNVLPTFGSARLAVTSDNGAGGGDAIVTDAGVAISLALADPVVPSVLPVPGLHPLALALLVLALGAVAAWVFRRWPANCASVVPLILAAGIGLAWAATVVRDGQIGDWLGIVPIATDAAGNAPVNADLVALFTQRDAANLYFRIDADVRHDALPPVNQPPVVNAGADQTITLPATAVLSGSATDDGLPNPPALLTYAWSQVGGPAPVVFTTPTEAATGVQIPQAGAYSLRLTVSDGALPGSDDVVVTVLPEPNQAPKLAPVGDRTIRLGERLVMRLRADDPNPRDTLAFFLDQGPAGSHFNPGGSPIVDWTPVTGQLGVHNFAVRVRDSGGLQDTQSFTVTVLSANRPPVLAAQPNATVPANGTFTRTLTATDPDNDALTFALLSGPPGMTLTGPQLQWQPTDGDIGEHFATVRVADPGGLADVGRFALSVRPAAKPVARDDHYAVVLGEVLTVPAAGVLANDDDPNGGALTAAKLTDPGKGALQAFSADGGFVYQAPATLPPPPPLAPVVNWHADPGLFSYAMAIGDLDGDGVPDVVHLAYNTKIRALKGGDGSVLWSLDALPAPYNNCSQFLGDHNIPMIADIDDDGKAEIVFHVGCSYDRIQVGSVTYSHLRVMALNGKDGTVKWLSPRLIGGYDPLTQAPSIPITEAVTLTAARLAPGETPSILGGHTIESFSGGIPCPVLPGAAPGDRRCRYVFALNGSDGSIRRTFYSAPADQALPAMGYNWPGLGGTGRFEPPVVLDFDGDGTPEVAFEGSLWAADGTLIRQFDGTRAHPNSARMAAADLDGDGSIDLVLLDAIKGRTRALRIDGTTLWDVPTQHCKNSLGIPCSITIADVDHDGQPEILIGGRDRLVVLDRFGRLKWARQDAGTLVGGYPFGCDGRPAVYDLDGDGVPEVMVRFEYNILFLKGTTGEELTRFNFGPNTYAYACTVPYEIRVADVDGDGHAEVVFASPYDGVSGANYGGIWVLKSGNDPWMSARTLFNEWGYVIPNINDDLSIPATPVRPSSDPGTNVYAQQQQLATRPELRTRTQASFTYAALAQGIASDPATVTIDILPPNRPPQITSTPPSAASRVNFSYQLTATDPDAGDTLTWSLRHADFYGFETAAGIDASTGLLTKPGSSNDAPYLFIVRVTDSQGAYAEQAFVVNLTNRTATVPNVIGQIQGTAQTTISSVLFVLGSVTEQFDTALAGQVIGQAPGGGAVVTEGTAVQLTISRGPQPRFVPNVLGLTQAGAGTALAARGFTIGTVAFEYSNIVARGEIMMQAPTAGDEVVPGAVDLTVSGGTGLELKLSSAFTSADTPITVTLVATDPAGNAQPTPALTYLIVPAALPHQGPLPTLNGNVLQFDPATLGAFILQATETGGPRTASAPFAVTQPGAPNNPPDLIEFTQLSATLQTMDRLLHEADVARIANDIPTVRARVIAMVNTWRTTDRSALRLAVPFSPESGFPPSVTDLAGFGVSPGPDDAINKKILRDSIVVLEAWTAGLRAPGTSLAQLQTLAGAFANQAKLLKGLSPDEYGTVDTAREYAVIAAHRMPDLLDALMDEMAVTVGMPADSQKFPRLKSTLAEQLTEIAVEQIVQQINSAQQFVNQILGQAAYGMAVVAIAHHVKAFVQAQDPEAIVSGASLSFRVFEAPFSFIEGRGLEAIDPDLNTVVLIGPSLLGSVQDVVNKIKGAAKYRLDPADANGRYKNMGEIKKDMQGFKKKLEDLLGAGQGLVDEINNAFQTPDKNSAGQCVFTTDPTCVQLFYPDGFNSVYKFSPPAGFPQFTGLPLPIVFIIRNNVNGQILIDIPPFFPTPAN